MKKINAVNNHVIVREFLNVEKKKESGIIIPETIKAEPQKYGEVISAGEKVENVKTGDTIMFHQSGGQAVIVDGVIYRVLKNDEVYAVITEV